MKRREYSENEVCQLTGARLSGIGCTYVGGSNAFTVLRNGAYDMAELEFIAADLIEANRALAGRCPGDLRAEALAASRAVAGSDVDHFRDCMAMGAREFHRAQWRDHYASSARVGALTEFFCIG